MRATAEPVRLAGRQRPSAVFSGELFSSAEARQELQARNQNSAAELGVNRVTLYRWVWSRDG